MFLTLKNSSVITIKFPNTPLSKKNMLRAVKSHTRAIGAVEGLWGRTGAYGPKGTFHLPVFYIKISIRKYYTEKKV